jgi:L-ribulose-5-phosphate 4-epimerase
MSTLILDLKKQLIEAAHRAFEIGVQTNSGGNFSVRIPGEELMIVKPRGLSFGQCDESSLVITDLEGTVVDGDLAPTKEIFLHASLYKVLPWAGAIMHCHDPWAIAWASSGNDLELCTFQAQLKFSGKVKTVSVESTVVSSEEMPKVLEVFQDNPKANAFLLKSHGTVTIADNILAAEQLAELVEETAKVAILSRFLGGCGSK